MKDPCLRCEGEMYEADVEFVDEVKSEEVRFITRGLKCNNCNETAVDARHLKEYYKKRADVYRKEYSLLTTDDFLAIRANLKMSQQAFADFIGVAVRSVKRWENGCVQNTSEDKLIRSKLELKALKNGRRIPTKVSIIPSSHREYPMNDIADYLNYQFHKITGNFLTQIPIQKLTYYSQRWFLTYFGRPLFSNDFFAWAYGPVIKELHQRFSGYSNQPITETREVDLPGDIKAFLNEIIDVYGFISTWDLVDATHQDIGWKNASSKCDYSVTKACDEIIPKDEILKDGKREVENSLYRWIIE